MKNNIIIFLIFLSLCVKGQHLTQLQYYFNEMESTNGGIINISGALNNSELEIPVGNLSPGLHTLFVRVKDNTGKWSMYESSNFFLQQKTTPQLEYSFDEMHSGNGGLINITNTLENTEVPISMDGLTPGLHTIFIRVKDDYNKWSAYYSSNFVLGAEGASNPKITRLEYYVGDDPGVGKGTEVILAEAQIFEGDVEIPLTNQEIEHIQTEDPHIHLRVRESANFWSGTASLEIDPSILSVKDIFGEEGIKIYPNPTSGELYFSFSDLKVNKVLVEVYSTLGKLIKKENITNKDNINISNLSTGVYLLNIYSDGKLIKQSKVIKK